MGKGGGEVMTEENNKTIGKQILRELKILQEVYLPGIKYEGKMLKTEGIGSQEYLKEKLDKSKRSITRLYDLTSKISTR